MTQNVLYLPPGVAPPPVVQPAVAIGGGPPFDRAFFERVLQPSVEAFCKHINCEQPVVEVTTIDGITHYVMGISGIADQWVALQTADRDHTDPAQVFLPYQTIFRVEIHPDGNGRERRLGFLLNQPKPPVVIEAEAKKPTTRRKTTKKS